MTPGLCRAALCVLVLELSQTPGCQVLSATTDGLMVAVPRMLVPERPLQELVGQDLRSVLPEVVTRCEQ